ncbi:type 4 pilus major pilin [Massilia sp. BJB1822]|uniref:type 4 pilus major pilin n=1 Tax=Massilia sp. BJB1822 TaxID=2744470 RepID=UPI001592FEE2|nr:type 4 pilus major pilin [Massilia sp. BJB1822]NVE00138.1 pilus assembly protein [Massilia sp. BJB1822]
MTSICQRAAGRLVRRHFQRGASLLEGIAYLGIAAIVILGAVSLLTSAFGSANTNRSHGELTSIRTGVKKLFMGQADGYGTADLTETLIKAKAYPSSLFVSGTTLKNSWNGAVTVGGSNNTFKITYGAVPKDVCVSMVSGGNDWTSVKVNTGADTPLPITPAAAAVSCSEASNTIVWTAT